MANPNLYKGGVRVAPRVDRESTKDDSLDKIIKCIDDNNSFILDAGAGSGKTWSLIETLKYLIKNNGDNYNRLAKNIGCITYTNVAVEEIKNRIGENEILDVNTIHKFLWDVIKQYQVELKDIIINNYEDLESLDDFSVKYKDFREIEKGIISHDDVIEISSKLFENYKKLQRIFIDKYPLVLVDEYQDTHPEVVTIFLDLIDNEVSKNDFIVGYFGDSMQSIYEKRAEKIKNDDKLTKITKESNFRSAGEIIDLLNHIRTDIEQFPAGENKKIVGTKYFIYDDTPQDKDLCYEKVKEKLEDDWGDLKVFFLTHRRIAINAGFENLFEHYNNYYGNRKYREKLYNKECPLISFLADRVEQSISYYENNNIFALMDAIDFDFLTNQDKSRLKSIMDELIKIRASGRVKDIWELVFDEKLFVKGDKIKDFQNDFEVNSDKKEFYNNIMELKYKEIINFYNHNENDSIFSTQHGTKGEEYENVLLVTMARDWSYYNFAEYLTGDLERLKASIRQRTQNLFYVSCSRAVKNLAVLYLRENKGVGLTRVKDWFGEENVIAVDEFLESE
jgi:DNA helicase-2/ATP-dependent DNA helicase PcrA